MSSSIRENTLDLAWSLWSELGVSSVIQNHGHCIIDPEPLIIATPTIAKHEPRLVEQVSGWCVAHSDRISASRLKGLLREATEPVAMNFSGFSTALRGQGVKWPSVGSPGPCPVPSDLPSPPLPIRRPSLQRFRLRALSGVGARADILCELLARERAWVSAAQLARSGYTKRNVSRVLSELEAAGLVATRMEGNAFRFRLARGTPLLELAGGDGLAIPRW